MTRIAKTRHLIAFVVPASLAIACGDDVPEQAAAPEPDRGALAALGIDPAGVHCVPLADEARAVEPPPAPDDEEASDGEHDTSPVPLVCPAGFVPEYGAAPGGAETPEGTGTVASALSCPVGAYYYAGAQQNKTTASGYGVGATLSIHDRPLNAMTGLCTLDSAGTCKKHSTSYATTVTKSSYYSLQLTSDSALRYGGSGGG